MIFIDTSAVVAILARESDSTGLIDAVEKAGACISAPHVVLEASMRLSTLFGFAPTVAEGFILRLFGQANITIKPIDEAVGHLAVEAFERFGKGRSRNGRLNFGDCLSYACAKANGAALLFKGDDFARTDIARA